MKRIAIIGGTGDLGRGLALRLSKNYETLIGSRDPAKAEKISQELGAKSGRPISGLSNEEAARKCDAAILSIPDLPQYDLLVSLKSGLKDKLVISPVVPMNFQNGIFTYHFRDGSAAESIARALESRVVAALHTVPAGKLARLDRVLDYDVLVAADTQEDYAEASELILGIEKLRPLYAGPLSSAMAIESLTPLLLNVGRLNKIKSPSVKVV